MIKQLSFSLCLLSCLHLSATGKKDTPKHQRRSQMTQTLTTKEKNERHTTPTKHAAHILPEFGRTISVNKFSGKSVKAALEELEGND